MKKLVSLILAIMMIAAVGAAWAAGDAEGGDTATDGIAGNTNGVWATADTPVAQGNTVTIYKEIIVDNPASVTVNAPTITYTYTIAAGSAGKDIYDAKGNHDPQANAHVLTKAGVGTPAITTAIDKTTFTTVGATDANKLIFTPAIQMNAADGGASNKYPIHITFTPSAFTGAGVYRYEITEAASTYATNGVVEGTTGHTRYLDVYVKDGSTAGTYEIYGYVCFKYNNNIDARDSGTAVSTDVVAEAVKTEGFVEGTDTSTSGSGDKTADHYNTYNVTIGKTLVNDQAMNSNQFPFKVQFSNTTVTDNVLPIVSGTGTYTAPTLTAGNINSFVVDGTSATATQNLKIANGGTVTFTGIPVGTTLTIDEYNNVAGTTYTTTTSGGTTNEADGINLTWNAWASSVDSWADKTDGSGEVTALQKTANDKTVVADENMTVTFTNTLLQISPTGYVSRFAPYALILVAGIVLLIVAKKRKPAKDDEE